MDKSTPEHPVRFAISVLAGLPAYGFCDRVFTRTQQNLPFPAIASGEGPLPDTVAGAAVHISERS